MTYGRNIPANASPMNSGTSFSASRQNEAAANKIPALKFAKVSANDQAIGSKNNLAKKHKSICVNNGSFLNNVNY